MLLHSADGAFAETSGSWLRKSLSVAILRALLAGLPDTAHIEVNRVGNLVVCASPGGVVIAYIDFAEESVEAVPPPA